MNASPRIILIRLALTLALALAGKELWAQPYMHSVGVRAGYSSGVTYKGFRLHRMGAYEGSILYNKHGFNLSALYEHHLEPFRNERFLVYAGGGAFGGDWDEEFSLGLIGVVGIEYNIRDIPLNLGVDWRPMFNIILSPDIDFLDFGLSIRYRFGS